MINATRGFPLVFATALACCLASCNTNNAPKFNADAGNTECTSGETDVCDCPPADLPGVRVCEENGTWSDCDCSNDDPCGDALLLVVDRSGSMDTDDKWTSFMETLEDTIAAYNDSLDLGLVVFPDETCDPLDSQNLMKLCRAPTNVAVDIDSDNLSTIVDKLNMLGPCGGTPTSGALSKALDAVASAGQETQVVLITDGLPNCNLDADGENCDCAIDEPSNYCNEHPEQCIDADPASETAATLFQSGVPVHVLGYTIETDWIDVMDSIAESGGSEESDYCPNDDALIIALERILDSITDC